MPLFPEWEPLSLVPEWVWEWGWAAVRPAPVPAAAPAGTAVEVPEVRSEWMPAPELVVPGAMWVSCGVELLPLGVVPEEEPEVTPVGSAPVFSPAERMQHCQQRDRLGQSSSKGHMQLAIATAHCSRSVRCSCNLSAVMTL